jgi:hypothetical protein
MIVYENYHYAVQEGREKYVRKCKRDDSLVRVMQCS